MESVVERMDLAALKAEHAAAIERLASTAADANVAEKEVGRLMRILNPQDEEHSADQVIRLEAGSALQPAQLALAKKKVLHERAIRTERDALAAVRVAEDVPIAEELRAVYKDLFPLLLKARPLCDKLAVIFERRPMWAIATFGLLQSGTPSFEPTLDIAIRYAKENGWFE
jgi:hypothetical protein